jgi:hypothetical protein
MCTILEGIKFYTIPGAIIRTVFIILWEIKLGSNRADF